MRKIIACAISGGVDSLVAAFLLKKSGYNILGVYMKNWDNNEERGMCNAEEDMFYAESNCRKLGIPFYIANFVKEYWNMVFENVLLDYRNGYTPNPDILCNKEIKFGCFLDYCLNNLEVDLVATGHYAKNSMSISELFDLEQNNLPSTELNLMESRDIIKDQTFFLSSITQKALSKCTFPLASFTKDIVKTIARANGFANIASKPESMGMCFVGKRRQFNSFMQQYSDFNDDISSTHLTFECLGKPIQSKDDFNIKGNNLSHNECPLIDVSSGLLVGYLSSPPIFLTVGQRITRSHGTIIKGMLESKRDRKYYVVEKDVNLNLVYVANSWDHPAMYSTRFVTSDPHWINSTLNPFSHPQHPSQSLGCYVKHVSIEGYFPCTISPRANEPGLEVKLKYPSRAITPGQYAVFYNNFICLGNARIHRVEKSYIKHPED